MKSLTQDTSSLLSGPVLPKFESPVHILEIAWIPKSADLARHVWLSDDGSLNTNATSQQLQLAVAHSLATHARATHSSKLTSHSKSFPTPHLLQIS